MSSSLLERFILSLLEGSREGCRWILHEALQSTPNAATLYEKLLWPAMERIEKLFRGHRICSATEQMATRITRTLADQLQSHLERSPRNHRRVVMACADGEPEELSAQIGSDLFESHGWEVYFIGGGVPNDEIHALLGRLRPDLLLIVGTQPQGVPGVRALIDMVREVDAHPAMNIMVSGGVFNRAAELWKEIHADLFASTISEALQTANASGPRRFTARVHEVARRRPRRKTARPTGGLETTTPAPAADHNHELQGELVLSTATAAGSSELLMSGLSV